MSRSNSRQSVDHEFQAVLQTLDEGTSWEIFAGEQRALLLTNEENMKENARLKALEADAAYAMQLSEELNEEEDEDDEYSQSPEPAATAVRSTAVRATASRVPLANVPPIQEEDEEVGEFPDEASHYNETIETFDAEESDEDELGSDSEGWSESEYEDEVESYEGLVDLAANLGDIPRLPKINVKSLPTRQYGSPAREAGRSTGSECVICLNLFCKNESLRRLPCFHEFHVHCIDKWLSGNNFCPICRLEL